MSLRASGLLLPLLLTGACATLPAAAQPKAAPGGTVRSGCPRTAGAGQPVPTAGARKTGSLPSGPAPARTASCGDDCYTVYNEELIRCYGLPRGGMRVECISNALAALESCVRSCPD
jgi:hypothetical protein